LSFLRRALRGVGRRFGRAADYVEDCPVCCRPIELHLRTDAEGDFEGLDADRE